MPGEIMAKHGVTISDLHCGHKFGLCPPYMWEQESDDPLREKIRLWQMKTWDWYQATAQSLGHLDRIVINGDAVEGNGIRSGGTELCETDRIKQAEMALYCIHQFDFDRATVIEGTNYHTGDAEQFEAPIAKELGTRLQEHAWLEHAGCVIDFKHHLGSSSVPRSIPPALPREAVWNLLWSEHELQPKANVFFRSHLHTFFSVIEDNFIAFVTPALQGWTRYGGTRMSKTISYGFLEWWISDKGEFTWKLHRLIPRFAAAKVESM
jgi:hypothetical protein